MTVEIPLSQGYVALVDDADAARVLAAGKWCASVRKTLTYAVRNGPRRPDGGSRGTIRLHNFLTGWPFVDHINGDGLDNRRANLRPADKVTNPRNIGKQSNNTSGFKGVSWDCRRHKWRAAIGFERRSIHLGYFTDPSEAARAYDLAAIEYFGPFARTNCIPLDAR